MLTQLVYTSTAIQPMPKSKLYKILADSRVNNKLADVTGALVYADGNFLQVLEGNQEAVSNLVEKIAKDRRHKDIKVSFQTDIERRTFKAWEMAYVSPSTKELATWAGLKNTTTVDSTLEMIAKPGAFQPVLAKLLLAIPTNDQAIK